MIGRLDHHAHLTFEYHIYIPFWIYSIYGAMIKHTVTVKRQKFKLLKQLIRTSNEPVYQKLLIEVWERSRFARTYAKGLDLHRAKIGHSLF